ncbi:hypothetical protein [Chelatococcus reniformis]|uniref:Uncharacterized protein n=1 Tax=Chelatococcus reniformis TaxID=1494448 RepID=A0A916X7T6_9HYPH|nr:hypothetical protein [Chelatococcus reniformis]GGC47602.1 hypothetical protein GCM10010994_03470 [Chelatococcus reniformis]
MLRGLLFPLFGAFLASRSASGRHSRLTSAILALLAARLGRAGPGGLAGLLLGFLVQGWRGGDWHDVATTRRESQRRM